jgi:hypothetical protein
LACSRTLSFREGLLFGFKVRDNFSPNTVTEIGKAVGFRCSKPDCGRATVGSNARQDGIVMVGVAAHICAASPGGPRYNAAQTREERRSKGNGIWLCQNCGRIVDADPPSYPVEKLKEWKRGAQEKAFLEVVAASQAAPNAEAARIGSLIAFGNREGADAAFDEAFAKFHAAATADFAGYTRGPLWKQQQVELTLKILDQDEVPPFSISKLPPALEVAPEITIVAPPGTGKTITVLQLTRFALSEGTIVPLYFRLGEVSEKDGGLFGAWRRRPAFQGILDNDFVRLAERGRVLFVLDGWNELEPGARRQIRLSLEQVQRDWPHLRVIVTTRQQVLDVPVSGPRLAIEPLSEPQQMAIARALAGETGVKIVDEARRTDGVRQLIAAPLYLSTLMASGVAGARPTTKEGLLRLFVEKHERAPEHAEALNTSLLGCHTLVLRALANRMMTTSTTINEADARRVVTKVVKALRDDGLIAGQPEPLEVLDALASHHVLTRSGSGQPTFAFQHQQFQEWFGSYEVEDLMRRSASGESLARDRLRSEIMDQPAWEESVFFAAERVSREEDGAAAVAHAVLLAVAIDPMLAAEIIFRSASGVWDAVGTEMQGFVQRWHMPGNVDRAVRFMIMTGRPEFAPLVWPLAASEQTQDQLPTLRTAPRFRPAVLGPDVREKIATLPEAIRGRLLTFIVAESGVDGMDLATELAKVDSSSAVQAEIAGHLEFRGASRHLADLMSAAKNETWGLLATRGYASDISDPAIAERLKQERIKQYEAATTPQDRLNILLEQPPSPRRDKGIADAISNQSFATREQHDAHSIFQAQRRAPAAVALGLRQRIERRLELPFRPGELLTDLAVEDDGPVAAAVLDLDGAQKDESALGLLAGPKTVGQLIERFLGLALAMRSDPRDKAIYEGFRRVKARIAAARPAPFIEAILNRAETDDTVETYFLADLVAALGDANNSDALIPVPDSKKEEVIVRMQQWTRTVLASPQATRADWCEVSNAIGRWGFTELVPQITQLLDRDLVRLRELMGALARGDRSEINDARMRYSNQYQIAFARIGGDATAQAVVRYLEEPEFGFEAAHVLKSISDRALHVPKADPFRRWPWFDGVAAAREQRAALTGAARANSYSEPIFAAIDRLAVPDNDKAKQLLAIRMAWIALAMPHGDQEALLRRVVALPQPLASKSGLFAATVMDGQIVDSSIVMQAIDEWLAEANGDPNKAWHKRQNAWEIEPWLELLPFTEAPERVFEGLEKVKSFYSKNWAQRWERVLSAVAWVPGAEGENLLARLARTHKNISGEFEWMRAILRRDRPAAILLFVDLLSEGVFGQGPNGVNAWHVGRDLAQYAAKFPELKPELKKRLDGAPRGSRARAALENLFSEIASESDVVAMIDRYAAEGRLFDQQMGVAVYGVTIDQVPLAEGSNTYDLHPKSVKGIRYALFARLAAGSPEAELAKGCLRSIDKLRDEHGIASNDPRHPDVRSGKPWPEEALPLARVGATGI